MKKYAGYINLKYLNGVLYPSFMQNIMMKEYIQKKLHGSFYLSPTEILQAKFPITLNTLLSNDTDVAGIVMLSTFYLPDDYSIRKEIYKKSIKSKKTLHFILDELNYIKSKDVDLIEEFIMFNNEYFTNVKKDLNQIEKEVIKGKNRNINFV